MNTEFPFVAKTSRVLTKIFHLDAGRTKSLLPLLLHPQPFALVSLTLFSFLENFTSLHKNVLSLRLAGEYWWLFGASRRFGAKSGVRAGGDRR